MRRIAWLAAIVMGVASLALFAQYKQSFEERVGGGEKVPVLVAASEIHLGALIEEHMLAIRDIPERYVDARHIPASEAARVIGIRTTMGLRSSEALLWTDLAAASDDRRILSSLVQSGMRAITVRIEHGASLGGLLRPGDRIDLLLRAMRDEEPMVLPLLQNILVLAVGSDIGASDNIIEAVQGGSALTLGVTVQQAQALTLAQGEGTLAVSLRNPDDILVQRDSPVTTAQDIHLAAKRAALQDRRQPATSRVPDAAREIEHVD